MRGNFQTCVPGFFDDVFNVVNRINILLVVNDNFDYQGAELNVLANCFSNFVARVREKILGTAELLTFRLQIILSAKRRNNSSGINYRWTRNYVVFDCE